MRVLITRWICRDCYYDRSCNVIIDSDLKEARDRASASHLSDSVSKEHTKLNHSVRREEINQEQIEEEYIND